MNNAKENCNPIKITKVTRMSLTELANFYDTPIRIVKRWLKAMKNEIGPKVGRYYTPKQVRIIIKNLGIPDSPLPED